MAEPIEFSYEPPESPCVPVSSLAALSVPDPDAYVLVDPLLQERDDRMATWCTYMWAEIGDDDEDMVLDDHILITSQVTLFRQWSDSRWAGRYPDIPVRSDDAEDWWVVARGRGGERDWWEGCGPATPCDDDEASTVRTRAWETHFEGHAGNLEFYVHVLYIAQELPADAATRTLEVFQDLVMASLDNWEQVTPADP